MSKKIMLEFKVKPTIDIKGKTEKEIDDLKHDLLMDITLNPHDYLRFVDVKKVIQVINEVKNE